MTFQDFQEYFSENADKIFNRSIPFENMAKKVKQQAITHMRRDSHARLLEERRPNEPIEVLEYRLKNARNITKASIDKYMDMISRINVENLTLLQASEKLNDWLNTNPYMIRGMRSGLRDFIFNCVILESLQDPNGILIDIPLDPDNPDLPPSNKRSNSSPIKIESHVVGYENLIRLFPFLVVNFGKKKYTYTDSKGKQKEEYADYYFIADEDNWYRIIPVSKDSKTNKTIYEPQFWYNHDCKHQGVSAIPINFLIGVLTTSPCGKYKYHESFANAAFEWGDEGLNKFSDYQAVSVQHHHPIPLMVEMDCISCKGKGYLKSDNGMLTSTKCKSCQGHGKQRKPPPYGALIVPSARGVDPKGTMNPPYQYVEPPVASIDSSFEHVFKCLDQMDSCLGVDVVGGVAESGEAKKMRMQVQQDNLTKIFNSLKPFIERHLWNIECLLEDNEKDRIYPILSKPNSFINKTLDMLLEDVNNAIGADKLHTQKVYLNKLYEDQPKMQRIYELAFDYEPHLAFIKDKDYIQNLKDDGCLDCNDIIRINRTVWAFTRLSKIDNFLEESEERLFAEADTLIQPFLREIVPIFEGDDNGGG